MAGENRLILLDRDPHVVGIASQPFWLHWHEGTRRRRHAPDYFVRLADGGARIVDVRAEDEMDEATREAFDATGHACRAVGWEFEWAGRPEPVFMARTGSTTTPVSRWSPPPPSAAPSPADVA